MSPITGPVATAIAFALAVAFGVASHGWELREARYEARIAQLTDAADRTQASLRTELASCRAQGEGHGQGRMVEAEAGPSQPGAAANPAGARRLLEQQPEGIDACARMESADRAVLSNLKK
ncbi:MAG: hypothetical protein JF588_06300 [Caulobacterales bacterium]|nr:hypothetical protein [Caulobacterales bacterium]